MYDYHKNYNLKISKNVYLNSMNIGLVNNGNTCFINSIIQCLFYTNAFTDYIMNYKVNLNKPLDDTALISLYKNLTDEMLLKKTMINPHRIIKCIKKKSKEFNNFKQQDSHEFLLFFLNTLHDQIRYEVNMVVSGSVISDSDRLIHDSLLKYKKNYEKDYSFIIYNFHGLQKSKLTCKCKPRNLFEPFIDIVLDLGFSDNLTDLLDIYFNKTILDKCNDCNIKICKTVELWNPPNHLIITLNRHIYNERSKKKLIYYPLQLNITNHISKDKHDTNKYIYKLYAINYHIGNQDNGHYISACKNLQDKWFWFDDTNVDYINSLDSLVNENAYILFYHREFILSN